MHSRQRLNAPTEDRATLAQDVEFMRFLSERKADAQREADRLQSEIDTLLEQADGKRREQGEHLTIVEVCTAGLGIHDSRRAPGAQGHNPNAR